MSFKSAPTQPSDSKSYIVHISFRRAHSLPAADILTLSSDPFVIATLRFPNSDCPKLHYRTRTLRRTLEPEWDETWSVANVPATGINLKLKVMDEDFGGHDDTLGVAHIETGRLTPKKDEELSRNLSMRKGGDAWITMMRIITVGCGKGRWRGLGGVADVRIQVEVDNNSEVAKRTYTIGPYWWSQHFSPLIGVITNTTSSEGSNSNSGEGKVEHYAFVATKLQLRGPLPPELEHCYVAFRPLIKTFYTKSGISGRVLNRALKHQYRTIYSYNKKTQYGFVEPDGLAKKFLEMTHWGQGGRLYTYVITLDSEWRFTETGKEFSIQWLSKHTMHSCVSMHVGFAGEFFVRPTKHHRHPHEGHVEDFELVIDNDSGTYRPPKGHLDALQAFLSENLKELKVTVADCFDEEHMAAKKAHVMEKDRSGRRRFKQPSRSRSSSADSNGSISSSDEEELRGGKVGIARRVRQKAWDMVDSEDAKAELERRKTAEAEREKTADGISEAAVSGKKVDRADT